MSDTMIETWWDETDGGAWIVSRVDADTYEERKMLRAFAVVAVSDPEDQGGGREARVAQALDLALDYARGAADGSSVRVRRHDGTVRYA